MVFVNHGPEQPPPINPVDRNVLYDIGVNVAATDDNGMHSRRDVDQAFLAATELLLLENPAVVGLSHWQLWGQGSWKKPHGSYEAAERFGGKLREEYDELFANLPTSSTPINPEDKRKICDEAGDVAWCVIGLVSNGSGNIEDGVKQYLFDAIHGIRYIDETINKKTLPPWKIRASTISTTTDIEGLITIGDIDTLVADDGFVAEPSNQMNLFYIPGDEYDEDPDIREYALLMLGDIINLQNLVIQQYGYGEQDNWIGPTTYMLLRNAINVQAAKILFQLALITYKSCGGSLAEAVALNSAKLQTRVVLNLVDKTDGVRPPEAL